MPNRGFAASLAMYIPASAIVWTSFENLRKFLFFFFLPLEFCVRVVLLFYDIFLTPFWEHSAQKALLKEHPSNPMIWAVCGHHTVAAASAGFLSGVCSGILTNPIDVVKTRVQVYFPKQKTHTALLVLVFFFVLIQDLETAHLKPQRSYSKPYSKTNA